MFWQVKSTIREASEKLRNFSIFIDEGFYKDADEFLDLVFRAVIQANTRREYPSPEKTSKRVAAFEESGTALLSKLQIEIREYLNLI